MKSPNNDTAFCQELVEEIMLKDFYGLTKIDADDFDHILDLGANIGVFSAFARALFPRASITAVEANTALGEILKENVNGLDVEVVLKPVSPKTHCRKIDRNNVNPGCTIFGGSGDEEGEWIEGVTLAELADGLDLSRTLVKIDIEGGERLLFEDDRSVGILAQCRHVVCETHFGPSFVAGGVGWNSFTSCDDTIREAFLSSGMIVDNVNRHPRKDPSKEDASGFLLMTRSLDRKGFWLSRCPRCTHDHYIHPEPLKVKGRNATHWAKCPNTGQPILLQDGKVVD